MLEKKFHWLHVIAILAAELWGCTICTESVRSIPEMYCPELKIESCGVQCDNARKA